MLGGLARAVAMAVAKEGHVADVVDRLVFGRLVVGQVEVDIEDQGGVGLPLDVVQVQAQMLGWLGPAASRACAGGGGVVRGTVMLVATDDRCMGPPAASVVRVTTAGPARKLAARRLGRGRLGRSLVRPRRTQHG